MDSGNLLVDAARLTGTPHDAFHLLFVPGGAPDEIRNPPGSLEHFGVLEVLQVPGNLSDRLLDLRIRVKPGIQSAAQAPEECAQHRDGARNRQHVGVAKGDFRAPSLLFIDSSRQLALFDATKHFIGPAPNEFGIAFDGQLMDILRKGVR